MSDPILSGKTILVADDEADLREIIREELEAEGCKVIEASNGKEAYERSLGHTLDAIVSDVRMPGGDGVGLLRKVRSINPISPVVIIMSGYTDISHLLVYQLGAYAVFIKPFKMADLKAALRMSLSSAVEQTRRRHPRIPVALAVEIELGQGNVIRGTATNLGRGGFFIQTEAPIAATGSELRFKFQMFEGDGYCRWVRSGAEGGPPGMGIEFSKMSEQSLEYLTQFLEGYTGA